ncbi:MAG: 2-phospho-L-lactate guanylyltransferase [Anaerolineae bacterium]|nr:2-phospho-L-lactate guanylyltransferase [Anaerolineae bacterium]
MFTIIPAKPFHEAKTRLSSVLTPDQRAALSQRLLHHTIDVASHIGDVVVISRSSAVRRLAKQAGAWALVEGESELNAALCQAAHWVAACHRQPILILPGDLPLLTTADLTEMMALHRPAPSMVIAPCRRDSGTNALFLDPPDVIDFQFGPNSFAKHMQAAQTKGIAVAVYHSPSIAFDVDLPEDVILWGVEIK